MVEGKEILALLPKSWKRTFNTGILIPTKMRLYNEFNKCNNQVNENKLVEANSNLLKRPAPNEFGHMLPYLKE